MSDKIEIVCQNRKANHDYHVLDRFEAGMVLIGQEVKSLRDHHCGLNGSYAVVENNEVWLLESTIDQYSFTHHVVYEPTRKRKLLLNKNEIKKLAAGTSEKGFTIVPMKIYFKNGRAKVELAICKGKQTHDKRESNKQRDAEREIRNHEN